MRLNIMTKNRNFVRSRINLVLNWIFKTETISFKKVINCDNMMHPKIMIFKFKMFNTHKIILVEVVTVRNLTVADKLYDYSRKFLLPSDKENILDKKNKEFVKPENCTDDSLL